MPSLYILGYGVTGNTLDSDSRIRGSNPCTPANSPVADGNAVDDFNGLGSTTNCEFM